MTIPQAFELGLGHHRAGRLAEAEAIYRQILAAQPGHADAMHYLGVVAHQTGRHELAVEWIRKAIDLGPNNPVAHSNLANALRAQGCHEEAISEYHRALRIMPDFPDAHNNLGTALMDLGELDEAIASFRRAIELKPHYPAAHNNLGNALKEHGEIDQAIVAYRRAIDLEPAYPEAHSNLGNALRERGLIAEAVSACRRAIQLKPEYPEARNNLGNAFRDQGRLDEAIAAYRQAIQIHSRYAEAYSNLGGALRDRADIVEAVAAYRKAIEIKPQLAWAHSNLIFTLHFFPDENGGALPEERRRWNRQFGDAMKPFVQLHAHDRNPGRRLRIGYVSPDFRDHPVGRNLLPLFRRHDRRNFEIVCYSGVPRADAFTEEFRRHADQWRSTVGVPDDALAELIRQDGVDILVDLAQHTAGNRLTMFARKPAPVQVSFAGYPESAGLEAIEYRISDRYLEGGFADDRNVSGENLRLIDSFWCWDPCGDEVEVSELPARETGRITFGCLNNFCKINEATLRLWSRTLGEVKDSRLIFLSGFGSHRRRTLDILEGQGVEPHRVEFVEHRPRREYLELYHRVDIALDTFPYNGHTTSLDALWMGVPVVTLAGKTPWSRAGYSQLTNLGLPELIANSEAEYVKAAAGLAADLRGLKQLRATLRERMENSVLMDAQRFARQIEEAYREMWKKWSSGATG